MAVDGVKIKLKGVRELVAGLQEFPKATAKNVLRRSLMQASEPMLTFMISHAPRKFGDLREGIVTSRSLYKPAARGVAQGGGRFRAARSNSVTIYVGPGRHPQAIIQEFGSFKEPAQPYVRPAYHAMGPRVLESIVDALAAQIEIARGRAARKAARVSRRGA